MHAAVTVGAALQNRAAATKDGQADSAALLCVELEQELRGAQATEYAANHIRVNVHRDGLEKTVAECSATRNVPRMVHVKAQRSANAVLGLLESIARTLYVTARMEESVWRLIRASAHRNGLVISAHLQSAMA